MRIVTFRITFRVTWQIAERLHFARMDAVHSRNQVSLPSAMCDDGPNLSISVSPGGESKRDSRSSGERKGRSRARGFAGAQCEAGERSWKGRRDAVRARWPARSCRPVALLERAARMRGVPLPQG